ncbi:BPSS1780 family membrane protein [Zeimonas arvi]|uniref:Transmembrane protein n=1 Tax=Zeimonas arvi TaxID=2498847 RepID=A0A5C8P534_9BURK|nr:BPSS1780 family membrane protein [Zeimonas arvi]TXL68244.1 hypothetical protein FHP08_00665 [Zeimonas arvi]
MQINPLRAATGWRWVRDGFSLLRRQPIALLAITFLNLMLLSLSVVIPLVGAVSPLVLTPALMVGLMHAVRSAEAGRMPSPGLLFAGFRDAGGTAWRPLLVLGGFNAAATLAALALAALADGGTLMRLATGQAGADEMGADDSSMLYAAIVFVLVYTPIQMAMWYAPLFAAWHKVPPAKALFFSFFAVWRNKWAFLVFGAGWFAVAFLASLAVRLLDSLLGDSPVLLSMLLSPLSLVLITAVYCSFWASYRDAVVDAQTPPG